MAELKFDNVPGSWSGNDYPKVAMTSVSLGSGPPVALIFMAHISIDYDGMGNAYGPANKCPLDSLNNAGWKDAKGYYGVKAYNPKTAPAGVVLAKPYEYYQDALGCVPAVQTSGRYKDYFISVTSGAWMRVLSRSACSTVGWRPTAWRRAILEWCCVPIKAGSQLLRI